MRPIELTLGLLGLAGLVLAAPSSANEDATAHPGSIMITDQEESRGNIVNVDVAADRDNCAPIPLPVGGNIASLYQWPGAVCTYWTNDCGLGFLHDHAPVFTVDSRGGMMHLRYLPGEFGPQRHRVGNIRCFYGAAADAFLATSDLSKAAIAGGDHATVDSSPLDGPVLKARAKQSLSLRAPTGVHDPNWRPIAGSQAPDWLEVCHDANLKGSCMQIASLSQCYSNPFNVDRINSLIIGTGIRCTFYLEQDCKATSTVPHYEEARTSPKVMNTVPYNIVSMTCMPIPF
ncbi:hypothetical protein ACN47E_003934 [Coniothyrium glycines]